MFEPKKGLKQIKFDFGVLLGKLKYKKFSFNGSSLCADVNEFLFTTKISMENQEEKCQTSMDKFKAYPGTLKIKYCDDSELVSAMVEEWFISSWNDIVVPDIEKKLETMLRNYLHNQFDCKYLLN